MHTMSFNPDDVDVALDGKTVSPFDIFPGFDRADRLGVVVTSSLGMLGASLLIHTFAAAYFKLRRMQGSLVTQYPEMYVFHVGGRYGDLRMIDILPERKELFVEAGEETLAAINHCAITRVAVCGEPRSEGKFHPWEMGPAKDRVRSTYLYSTTGNVEEPNIAIKGKGRHVFDDFHCLFDIQHTVDVHAHVEPDPAAWTETLVARAQELDETAVKLSSDRWNASVENGFVQESFQLLPKPTEFLRYI